MPNQSNFRVSNPPAKLLLIWDGECTFCRLWIERWREMTAGQVDYAASRDIGERFPEIPRDQFSRSMVLIEPDGQVFLAAEAVYRSLRVRFWQRWLDWNYNHLPGFAPISEALYNLIARHRGAASTATRLLWGNDVRPPTYHRTRRWFLRALGFVYLTAFVSLWVQIDGLIGENGVWPIKEILKVAQGELGSRGYWLLPTLCWVDSSNLFLHILCATGASISLLLIVEVAPAVSLVLLFVDYLSLTTAGQTFLSFQWDILLLESGFLAIFFAPWKWRPRSATTTTAPASRAGMFLLKFLLFKLMLMSGVVKLTSGDNSWWNLTALDYHYWSQPLPTVFAWYADKSPEWFKHFSVVLCLVIEIVVPFFMWAPRRLRLIAAGLMIFLQIAIAMTGNYCFFNLLTIALCLLLIDDSVFRPRPALPASLLNAGPSHLLTRFPAYAAAAVVIITLPLNLWLTFTAFKPDAEWPRPLELVYGSLEPIHVANGYGLFRVMTKDRLEIMIEGSTDATEWHAYEFKWKPGDVTRPPRWCAPHQPRLDWQMWFAALSSPQNNPWLVQTLIGLLQGKPDVEKLFGHKPFDAAPRYIRCVAYRYRFTTGEEHRQTGAWWRREEAGSYIRALSLEDVK